MESVVSLASDSACLYEQLGYMFLSAFFVRTLFYLTDHGWPGGGGEAGASGILVYPKKIRQNTQKYPKLCPGILYT